MAVPPAADASASLIACSYAAPPPHEQVLAPARRRDGPPAAALAGAAGSPRCSKRSSVALSVKQASAYGHHPAPSVAVVLGISACVSDLMLICGSPASRRRARHLGAHLWPCHLKRRPLRRCRRGSSSRPRLAPPSPSPSPLPTLTLTSTSPPRPPLSHPDGLSRLSTALNHLTSPTQPPSSTTLAL